MISRYQKWPNMTAAGVVLVVCDKQHNYLCVCQRGWGGACALGPHTEERVITAIVTTEHCHRGLITMQAALQRRKWVLYRDGDPGSSRDNGRGYTEEISHRENSIRSNATCYTCTLSVCLMLKCHFTLVCLLTNITKSYYWETTDETLHNTHNVVSV